MNILTKNYKLYNGDCLKIMDELIKEGIIVDCILTDPPYGTTACKWDSIIPLEEMWERLNKLIKPNGVIALFGTQPFVTNLIYSNIDNYKYNWYWKKNKQIGFAHSKNKPMRIIEEIVVFSNAPMGHKSQLGDRRMIYNPQGVIESKKKVVSEVWHGNVMGERPNQVGKEYTSYTNFPNDFLEYKKPSGKQSLHPTQKPTDLLEYLVKTYTDEGEIVLDFTMGSGSTGVACLNINRKFIGIELNEDYFNIAVNRVFENYNK